MANEPPGQKGKPAGESKDGAATGSGPAGGPGPGCLSGARPLGSLQRPDEVELLPVLAGEDGGLLVVIHQLVHGVEAPLPDAVDVVHQLHLEMLVLP